MSPRSDSAAPSGLRVGIKRGLAHLDREAPAQDATLLIYHRVGGGSREELDLTTDAFARQVGLLREHEVLSLDAALDRLDAGDRRPSVVLTFDDGFADVHENAWPVLRDHRLPFTIYLASGFMGSSMRWEHSTAKGAPGRGLSWPQLEEMLASGLCTIGNHTHRHVRPEALTADELDDCTSAVERALGVVPQHFTYPWGISVPAMEPALADRFRSASTGELGRNAPDCNRLRLRRVPVRRSDPDEFFRAKLSGRLLPERAYAATVAAAKALRVRA